MDVQMAFGVQTFCRIHKNETRLLKCAAGLLAQRGALKRSKVLEELKEKLNKASSLGDEAVAVAMDSAVAEKDDDPMDALDDLEEPEKPPPAKRGKYSPKRTANRIFEIDMPILPPTTSTAVVQDTRRVRVLGRNTNQLWLAVEDINWLVQYMAEEVALGGVPLEEPEPAVAGNCDIENLRIRWDFGKKAWFAELTAGSLLGKKFSWSVSSMTEEKWAKVQDDVGTTFAGATFEQRRKEGTRLYLQEYCAKLAGQAIV